MLEIPAQFKIILVECHTHTHLNESQRYLKVEALDFSDLLDKAHCELELKYSNITAYPVGISHS